MIRQKNGMVTMVKKVPQYYIIKHTKYFFHMNVSILRKLRIYFYQL